MKYLNSLFMICVAVYLTSCGKIASTQCAITQVLLTGECLSSPKLSYYMPDTNGGYVAGDSFVFGFTMDFSGHSMEKTDYRLLGSTWRDVPSDEIFETFGANRQAVKNEFERIFEEFTKSYSASFHGRDYSISTILYNGGISLTSNKDFAGCPAGEDLGSLITLRSEMNTPSRAGGFLGIPMDYICMTKKGIGLGISMGEHELVKESALFELKIPVKVVLYLTWLNDKLTDPNAPVPYKEEVLYCSFRTEYILK